MDSLKIKETNIADDYSIDWNQPLGSGINGEVYKCTNNESAIDYAVKILPLCDEAIKEIVIQWACKKCCYVVEVKDVYINIVGMEENSYLFIVMEYMNGGELFDYIEKKPVCEDEAKVLMRQIVESVSYLHTQNIVHRDLKPENILLSKSPSGKGDVSLKLADFGYAEQDNKGLTNALYTLYYVSPEVLINDFRFNKEGKVDGSIPYDKRCDLWSLGVVAYIMLMGYPPFYPEGPVLEMTSSMYDSIVSGSFFYEELDWNKYSEDARDFVFSLLKVDPEERPSAKELLQHPWLQSQNFKVFFE